MGAFTALDISIANFKDGLYLAAINLIMVTSILFF